MEKWKADNLEKAQNSFFKSFRTKQYLNTISSNPYVFRYYRKQTRYAQQNYVKSSYKTSVTVKTIEVDINYLEKRYKALKNIGFETTLKQYNSKAQRQLMTKELRKQIMERDNYTCQNCGKYMPDEVGLHIDHIKPISKGGKSVPSNLQVLCSKCNGKKSNKIQ